MTSQVLGPMLGPAPAAEDLVAVAHAAPNARVVLVPQSVSPTVAAASEGGGDFVGDVCE